jgi:acetyl esterase/lipase
MPNPAPERPQLERPTFATSANARLAPRSDVTSEGRREPSRLISAPPERDRVMTPPWQTRPVTAQTWTHADFPESTANVPRMRVVEGRPSSRNVHVHLGLQYAVKDGRALHLVVAQPSLDWATGDPADIAAERFPLVVFVQGSGWGEQELGANLEPLASFARRGYVVAIVEYRQASLAQFPAQIADTLTAARWLGHRSGFRPRFPWQARTGRGRQNGIGGQNGGCFGKPPKRIVGKARRTTRPPTAGV